MLSELSGLEYIINTCARLNTQLHTGLYPEVGYSLDDGYSVTQSSPGGYFYIK